MKMNKREVVTVGIGVVGTSYAHSLPDQSVCDGLMLIDINRRRTEGEAMDLDHDLAFTNVSMTIYAGDHNDCSDMDIVVICAGVAQKQGEARLDLLKHNTQVFRSIIDPMASLGFNGIFLVVISSADTMTRIACILSGSNPRCALGSGTALDTAGLRYLLRDHLKADPGDVHAYVIGEHKDSEFMPWGQALLTTKPTLELYSGSGDELCRTGFKEIEEEVCTAAYKVIKAKNAAYYGIGMALIRIMKAILGNEHSVLTVSAMLKGEYGQRDVYVGVPCVISQNGIQQVLPLSLIEEELEKLGRSCDTLRESYEGIL